MIPVTDTLRALVTRGHRRRAVVRLYDKAGDYQGDLPVSDGVVSAAFAGGAITRSGTLTVPIASPSGEPWAIPPNGSWAPNSVNHPLSPYGNYVTVAFEFPGLPDADGNPTVVDRGEYPIVGVTTHRPGGTVEVVLGDWSAELARLVADTPWAITSDAASLQARVEAVYARYYGATPTWTGDPIVDPVDDDIEVGVGGQPWSAILQAAEENDAYVRFTAKRTIEAGPYPNQAGGPVETIAMGDDGTLVSGTTSANVVDIVNQVSVRLVAKDPEQVRRVKSGDASPNLPGDVTASALRVNVVGTDTLGGLLQPDNVGLFAYAEEREMTWPTQARADRLAERIGRRLFGRTRKTDLRAIPMPWLQVGDKVTVVGINGTEEAFIESVELPLHPDGLMAVATIANTVPDDPAMFMGADS